VAGLVQVVGTAASNATVTLWGNNGAYARTLRKGEYYVGELAVTNSGGPVWVSVTNLAVLQNGTNADIVSSIVGSTLVSPTPETFTHDVDGNMTADGKWTLTWDAENRLIAMTNGAGVPAAARRALTFAYDYLGRRTEKIVYTNSASGYVVQYTNHFVYDGWNLIAVLDGGNNLLQSFVWGTDLSGSMQGAGGVGGLLAITDYRSGTAGTYFPVYDGNGNVVALVSAADGTIAAQYEYSPFGELLRATGLMAKANPFRISTRYQDDETDLVYYDYRYYSASTGRWLSRDPFHERGGRNLYGFVFNDPIDKADAFGLACTEAIGKNGKPRIIFTISPYSGGGWSEGTITFGNPAGGGAIREYTTVTAKYEAAVTVLCKCDSCYQMRNGTRVYQQQAIGEWPYYNPGTVGLGIEVPTVTAVLQGLGKLGAKWINEVLGAGVMVQEEIDDAVAAIVALPHPTEATDGNWKDGKSPCAQ
jgi:RHS repeat-associated protein